jgi:hypothetical protein
LLKNVVGLISQKELNTKFVPLKDSNVWQLKSKCSKWLLLDVIENSLKKIMALMKIKI